MTWLTVAVAEGVPTLSDPVRTAVNIKYLLTLSAAVVQAATDAHEAGGGGSGGAGNGDGNGSGGEDDKFDPSKEISEHVTSGEVSEE